MTVSVKTIIMRMMLRAILIGISPIAVCKDILVVNTLVRL
jgi:hypothetical protein